ncbi:M24 family metallopeptidase [Candidatus Bipolaricaulota bacterium]
MISELGLGGGRIGVDSGSMRYREIAAIQSVRPRVELHPVEAALEPLRLCKDDGEVACIRRAIRITESAMESTLNRIQAGMTEKDVCRLIEIESLRGGADGMAFEPMVVSGPRSALQHVAPCLRELKAGDCVILDVGACSDGYRADITRTLSIGSPDQVTERAHAVVLEANQAARAAIRPGVSAGSVDGAARVVIDNSEFRGRLIHGVGHGLGLDIHEPPIVASGASTILEPGMVFTVEPGVYLEGRMGVRVEDVAMVTATGSEYLTTISRDLRVL